MKFFMTHSFACKLLLILLSTSSTLHVTDGFVQPTTLISTKTEYDQKSSTATTIMYGAFNRKNKHDDLMKKMELAKKQREQAAATGNGDDDDDTNKKKNDTSATSKISSSKRARLSDEEIKKQNDLKRFQELLDSEAATVNYGVDGSGPNYLTVAQEEEEIDAAARGVDRIFEGDPAPTDPFENLVPSSSQSNSNVLGNEGTQKLVPWLHKNPTKQKDYLIVLSDPRPKSDELRSGATRFSKRLTADILARTIVINADTPAENRRWLKKQGITQLRYFSDEKLDWMRDYTALGEKRWSMCMFILADGRVQKLVRELDPETGDKVIHNAIKSLAI